MSTGLEVPLGPREKAVLGVLVGQHGRVIDRATLRRDAGLDDLSARRCDALLVGVRRALGRDAVVTVRRRGWRLSPDAVAVAVALTSGLG